VSEKVTCGAQQKKVNVGGEMKKTRKWIHQGGLGRVSCQVERKGIERTVDNVEGVGLGGEKR